MLHMNNAFKDKVVVITGGAGVLCSVFTKALASAGAKVAILGLHLEKAEKLAQELRDKGYDATGFACNVVDKESVVKCHQEVLEKYGPCDILINGAGGNSPKATTDEEFFDINRFDKGNKGFFDLDFAGFSSVYELNFMGTLIPTQIFGKDMVGKPGGVILNISSMNAFTPLTKIPAYSAAKAAISNFTQWLAVYFAKSGIRVNAIAPGFFSSEQNKALLWNPDGTPTARTNKIISQTPMGRFGEPDELLGTVLWLLDNNASSFVTGIVVPVDGGFSAYSGV